MMKTQFFGFLSFGCVLALMAGSVKWEMKNIYPKTSSELQAWTNSIPDDAIARVPFVELFEYQMRVDILWADYTNRMERVARLKEKRKAAEEKRKAEQARREALRRMSRRSAK